ncbi:unnamed protein product, partial [Rotaria sp. Silwood2]
LLPSVYSISNVNYPTNLGSMGMPMPMERSSSYSYSNVYTEIKREISQDIYCESVKRAVLDKIQKIDFMN